MHRTELISMNAFRANSMHRTELNSMNAFRANSNSVAPSTSAVAGLPNTTDTPVAVPKATGQPVAHTDTTALASVTGQASSITVTNTPFNLDVTTGGNILYDTFDNAHEAAAFDKALAASVAAQTASPVPASPPPASTLPAPSYISNPALEAGRALLKDQPDRAIVAPPANRSKISPASPSKTSPTVQNPDLAALGQKKQALWTAQDWATSLKATEKPYTVIDDSLNPVLCPGQNIRRSISADTTLVIPFTIPEGGVSTSFMFESTTGVAPLDGSNTPNLPETCISTTPGDFTKNVVPNSSGSVWVNTTPLPPTNLGDATTSNLCILEPGKTYYLNIRSTSPDAGTGFVLGTHSYATSADTSSTSNGVPAFLNSVTSFASQLVYPLLRNF